MIPTRFGPYEVLAKLGAGGMGEVYRARDPRLGREVAIKVVSGEWAAGSERLLRFQQEARTASALNHANILTVHDVGEHEGRPFLVTELLEGRSLHAVLAHGEAIPPARALAWCAQVARGLAAAHEKGIVHRDLKPENLFLCRDGRIKILDFGLARLKTPFGDGDAAALASAETLALRTEAGTVLGTIGYMAPEQARGEPADERADLFALGCVLYELLTATPAFRRSSPAETISSLLRDAPRTSLVPAAVPHAATRLLERLLAKDPAQRLRSAADLAIELDDLATEVGEGSSETPSSMVRPIARRRSRALLAVLALSPFAALVLIVALTRGRGTPAAAPPSAGPLALVPLTADEAVEEYPTWSPDGARIAFVRDSGGLRRAVLRDVESGREVEPTRGEFDELQPAFAAGGQALLVVRGRNPGQRLEPGDVFGIFRDADLWRIDLAGGAETKLVEGAYDPDVSPDGRRVAVEADWGGARRLWLIDAAGTNREQLTGGTSEAVFHLAPSWSPDGRWIAFQSFESTHTDVKAVEVASRRTIDVTSDSFPDYYPEWEADGASIVFSSPRGGGLNLWRVRVDLASGEVGRPEQLTQGAGQDVQAAAGPADHGIAFAVLRQNANLWRLPLDPVSGRPTGEPAAVVTSSREDSRGSWAPDGARIAFNSDRSGEMNLWIHDLASGATTQVTTGPGGDYQPSWSPDSRRLVFFSARSGSNDLWSVDLATRDLRRLTDAPGLEINPSVSPDGTAIAYHGDASGRFEVWLADAEGRGARPLTHVGVAGHFLPWSRDGRSIYFRCPSCEGQGSVMRVDVPSGELEALPWVKGGSHLSLGADERRVLDVTDHRFLWLSPLRAGAPEEIFHLTDPAARIDYPVLSPDGRAALFDRFQPQGGDIWRLSPRRP